jgi:pimeloyl-ACP methyl ester carboxylesterase
MTPLLLIPGMMCDARMWGSIPTALHPCPIVHAIPDQAGSMEAIAAAILNEAPPRFSLAGLSMGGIVAMEMLAQAPARIERLALLDTNPLAETAEAQARREPQIAKALAGSLSQVIREEMKPNYLASGPGMTAILDLCMDMAISLGPDVFVRQSRALQRRTDQQQTLASFSGPALVLMGEHDRLCPLDRHELMHALMPQSRLVIVKNAAHLPPLENPEETIAALNRWLDE